MEIGLFFAFCGLLLLLGHARPALADWARDLDYSSADGLSRAVVAVVRVVYGIVMTGLCLFVLFADVVLGVALFTQTRWRRSWLNQTQ